MTRPTDQRGVRGTSMSIIPRGRRLGPRWIGAAVALTVALGLAVAQGPIAVATGSDAPRGSKAITPARGTTVTSRFFGMHSSALINTFPAVPAGSVDLMTDGVYWPDLEKSPGTFDFTKL